MTWSRYLVWLCLVLMMGCTSTFSISSIDISDQFDVDNQEPIKIEYVLQNQDSSASTFHFKIEGNSLEKVKGDDGQELIDLSIRFKVYENYSTSQAVDSGMKVFKSVPLPKNAWLFDSLAINSIEGRKLIADVTVKDLNSENAWRRQFSMNRSREFTGDDALLFDDSGHMLYDDIVPSLDTYYLKSQVDEPLYVKYYNRDFPIASPPFASIAPKPFDFTPDDTWSIEKSNGFHPLVVDRPGLYLIVTSENQTKGASFAFFSNSFPVPKTVMDLMLPMRYITTKTEFDAINQEESLKKAVDAHWLDVAGNINRAKELIRAFYRRVEKSNNVFSSYIEGWKTDRGMCLIVYGPPTIVKRTSSTEVWIYGQEGQFNALRLTFTKVNNPFSENDYRLNRMPSLKSSWYRSVEYWRQGRVLTYQK